MLNHNRRMLYRTTDECYRITDECYRTTDKLYRTTDECLQRAIAVVGHGVRLKRAETRSI